MSRVIVNSHAWKRKKLDLFFSFWSFWSFKIFDLLPFHFCTDPSPLSTCIPTFTYLHTMVLICYLFPWDDNIISKRLLQTSFESPLQFLLLYSKYLPYNPYLFLRITQLFYKPIFLLTTPLKTFLPYADLIKIQGYFYSSIFITYISLFLYFRMLNIVDLAKSEVY